VGPRDLLQAWEILSLFLALACYNLRNARINFTEDRADILLVLNVMIDYALCNINEIWVGDRLKLSEFGFSTSN
jgi:hypothetical protein